MSRVVQKVFALNQGKRGDIVTIGVEQVEKVVVRRELLCAPGDLLRVGQMKSLLEHPEAGVAVFVETDDLAIYQCRPGEAFLQGAGNLGEAKGIIVSITAKQFDALAVKAAQDALTVEFRLENPIGIIKRFGGKRAEHWRRVARERGRLEQAHPRMVTTAMQQAGSAS